jgi:hypothetical protein
VSDDVARIVTADPEKTLSVRLDVRENRRTARANCNTSLERPRPGAR